MASIEPQYRGAYDDVLVYNMAQYKVIEGFEAYIESMEVLYRNISTAKNTGFNKNKYMINDISGNDTLVDLSINLAGNLPRWLHGQLIQLAKGVLGGGMELLFNDDCATQESYYCKWDNAADFVENTELINGGNMLLKCYEIFAFSFAYEYDGLGDVFEYDGLGDTFKYHHREN